MKRLALILTLGAMVACGAELDEPRHAPAETAGSANAPARATSSATTPDTAVLATLHETCDALDDDLDGDVDQGSVCARACGASALADAASTLRLPREGDRTVASDSGIQPQLLAYSTIPAFCSAPVPSADPDVLVIGCGESVTFSGGALRKKSIRIAPGGSLRLTGDTILGAEDILVCPNAVIQAGGAPSVDSDGAPGHDLTVAADQLVLLGTISTSGGFTVAPGKRGGVGGVLDVHVLRLLLAGLVETYAVAPTGAVRGEGGMVSLVADEESFFSGTLRSGNAYVRMPVCCAD